MIIEIQDMLEDSNKSRVQEAQKNLIAKVPYGSRLYGTETPTSDYDFKMVYLPPFKDVILGKKFTNFKARFDAEGNPILDINCAMPDSGFEAEYIALQTLLNDWFAGQTYAVELVFAINQGHYEGHGWYSLKSFTNILIDNWQTNSVSGMVGFAMKQTFDYVHRGARLKEAQFFLDILDIDMNDVSEVKGKKRLDSMFYPSGDSVFNYLLDKISKSEYADKMVETKVQNGTRLERAITFGGRMYVESTPISELNHVVYKRVKSYGSRTTAASESTIDPKSMMHAVRVYQQVIELLTTENISFPRTNRDELLSIRNLEMPHDEIVKLLTTLDAEVTALQEANPSKIQQLQSSYNDFAFEVLMDYYQVSVRAN